MIEELYTNIYRLGYQDCAHLCVLFCLAACLLQLRFRGKPWLRRLWALLLILWAWGVICGTLLTRGGGAYEPEWIPLHSYREIISGGNPELYRSNFMNALLFFPAGALSTLLLPGTWSLRRRLLTVLAASVCLSLSIELTQHFFSLGHFEADDILHNTIGAGVGFLLIPGDLMKDDT